MFFMFYFLHVNGAGAPVMEFEGALDQVIVELNLIEL